MDITHLQAFSPRQSTGKMKKKTRFSDVRLSLFFQLISRRIDLL